LKYKLGAAFGGSKPLDVNPVLNTASAATIPNFFRRNLGLERNIPMPFPCWENGVLNLMREIALVTRKKGALVETFKHNTVLPLIIKQIQKSSSHSLAKVDKKTSYKDMGYQETFHT
jgi:hypothetical protein